MQLVGIQIYNSESSLLQYTKQCVSTTKTIPLIVFVHSSNECYENLLNNINAFRKQNKIRGTETQDTKSSDLRSK